MVNIDNNSMNNLTIFSKILEIYILFYCILIFPMLEDILDKINLPIIIWKKDKTMDQLVCDFVNDKVNGIKIKDIFSQHHKIEIDKLTNHNYQLNGDVICFSNMMNGTYVEIRYPYVNNIYLLSAISKKLREPLTNIIGILSLLDQITSDSYIPIIQQSCYSFIHLANDLVDLIGIDNKTIKITKQPFLLQELLMKLEPFKEDCQQKGIQLYIRSEINYPITINDDQNKLVQILSNLLKNAVDYTSEGGVHFIVSQPKSNQILFKIKDTGGGLDHHKKQMVDYILNFCHSSSHLQYEGFGLFIANQLSKLLGAYISYQSELDIGSVFYLNYPIA